MTKREIVRFIVFQLHRLINWADNLVKNAENRQKDIEKKLLKNEREGKRINKELRKDWEALKKVFWGK